MTPGEPPEPRSPRTPGTFKEVFGVDPAPDPAPAELFRLAVTLARIEGYARAKAEEYDGQRVHDFWLHVENVARLAIEGRRP